ncbi:alpha/beta fold family hydrolase [Caballeronia temeraria]|uniref:Alpha/beta fold family hydrolase n=1 Tax=Caballeronia temeraria TaxID=1777137 RepID=A0A158B7N5_9BURK|nr:alpha/beta fold hydrolase [Caballeronia temeraria]SAK66091.1 alpha/beta fold family hydrolase [Caballeronia temeraria]
MNIETLARFPDMHIDTAHGITGYREAGAMPLRTLPVVLLHGIGSGAASWVRQLAALGAKRRVLAWDAPGYGVSTPVIAEAPVAADYANALRAWLDAIDITRCILVGHSLGAIVAGSFAMHAPERVAGLLLISPAAGYGAASKDVREAKRDARLKMLNELGPQGLARERSANMLSPYADDEAREWVRWNMARVIPEGYAQATHLLANADLAADIARFHGRIAVAVGAEDAITPPAACERIAQAAHVSLQVMPRAGHAGYAESPAAYTALIDAFCQSIECHMRDGVPQ